MNLFKKCRYGMMIYNKRDIWVGRSFDLYGEFSESEVQLFRELVKPGMVVLDVGANTGSHTVPLARFVGATGYVFAYEPERNNFYTLAGNVAINSLKNVTCQQHAVGNDHGTILVPELDENMTTNWGGLSLDGDYSKCPSYSVPIIKIDGINFSRLDFIKIDVEGMERDVLLGAEDNIRKFKPHLYVENDRADKSEGLISFLHSLGYVVYDHQAPLFNPNNYYDNRENVFVTKVDTGLAQVVSGNVFCHHKDVECPIDVNKFAMKQI